MGPFDGVARRRSAAPARLQLDKFLGTNPLVCETCSMASKRPRPPRQELSPQDRDLFLEAVSGTVTLGDRHLAPLPAARTSARAAAVIIERTAPPPEQLVVEVEGERYRARASGVSKAQVAELAGGKRHVSATLDLHGKSALDAADAVRGFLSRALAGQCVLIIHGKGLHSGGLSVLREATLAELMGPSSGMVHAFATAVARDGGEGATYVLVKR